jgi:hypothetical protein
VVPPVALIGTPRHPANLTAMRMQVAATAVLALFGLAGCTSAAPAASTGSPSAPSAPSPTPTPAAATPSPAGPLSCRTTDLEVAIAGTSGAAGHVGLDFEVRNQSAATCRLFGYFGLGLLSTEGRVGITATRSTRIFAATTGPPAELLLPPNSPPLPSAPAPGRPAAVTGHAHFAAAYSDVCDSIPRATGNAWQLFPPDETVPMSILGGGTITICALQVTPVQATPPQA